MPLTDTAIRAVKSLDSRMGNSFPKSPHAG